ncbi:phage holin [Limosilactobacillus reuteri]|uniref:phage holin n=1 Tax=Limosilactobacillus reuteri TaxID=1598 RepID=UPI0039BF0F76
MERKTGKIMRAWNYVLQSWKQVGTGKVRLQSAPLLLPLSQYYLGYSRIFGDKNMKKILSLIKNKLVKPDGTLNGKIISGLVALVIVFVQQVFACFGVQPKGDITAFVGLANTVLTILGLVGVLSDPTPVEVPTKTDKNK